MSSAEHTAPSSPGVSWPSDINPSLSEEEQRTIAMLYEQKMAEPPAGTPFLTFKLNNMRWGVAVSHLREALPSVSSITLLPFSPLWLYGLINLRGEPVGLVNLSDLLLDPITASNIRRRTAVGAPVIVAESAGVLLGLLVEELGEVVFLEKHHLQKLPAAAMRSLPSFAIAHLQAAWTPSETDQPVLLLNLARIITSLLQQLTSEEAP